jgi:hypothetical protein
LFILLKIVEKLSGSPIASAVGKTAKAVLLQHCASKAQEDAGASTAAFQR